MTKKQTSMREIAILLALTMLLGSLVGCLGGDDDEHFSPVGVWYEAESPIIDIKKDGTFVGNEVEVTGTWSTDGDTMTLTSDTRVEEFRFVIKGDWMWVLGEDGCQSPFAPEAIDEDEWYDRVGEQTPPSMCE